VVLDGAVLGKPADTTEARRMLTALRGRVHTVLTAVCVRTTHDELSGVVRSMVRMRDYATAEIERYVVTGSGLDKAGGYGVQDDAFQPVASIEGCYCNVMGLPLWTVIRFLERTGGISVRRPGEVFARCTECPLAG
jgi:nucleoside triphosphate pyrophosphatase